MNSRRLKLLLAMVGTGAVFASGLTLAYAETHSATGAPAVAAPQLTTGEDVDQVDGTLDSGDVGRGPTDHHGALHHSDRRTSVAVTSRWPPGAAVRIP